MAQFSAPVASTKKYILPSTEALPEADQAWVVLRLGKLLGGDIAEVDDFSSASKVSLGMLASRIQEWNFFDGDKAVPISFENVCRMELEDVGFLLNELKADMSTVSSLADPKKNEPSSDSSTQ